MFFIFYFSYLFSVMFLVFLVVYVMLLWSASVAFVKFLVILVYISGVVVFMLYISCMCWFVSENFSYSIIFMVLFLISVFDIGGFSKFSDVGEFMWMYLFFAFLFNSLVTSYSLNLYKVSGSLRF